MSGAEIRQKIVAAGLPIWLVANTFGVADTTFSKKLRKDFSDEDSQKILAIIEKLKNA